MFFLMFCHNVDGQLDSELNTLVVCCGCWKFRGVEPISCGRLPPLFSRWCPPVQGGSVHRASRGIVPLVSGKEKIKQDQLLFKGNLCGGRKMSAAWLLHGCCYVCWSSAEHDAIFGACQSNRGAGLNGNVEDDRLAHCSFSSHTMDLKMFFQSDYYSIWTFQLALIFFQLYPDLQQEWICFSTCLMLLHQQKKCLCKAMSYKTV